MAEPVRRGLAVRGTRHGPVTRRLRIPDGVLLRWDEIVARALDRTETCIADRPRHACVRRYRHRGRHVWREP